MSRVRGKFTDRILAVYVYDNTDRKTFLEIRAQGGPEGQGARKRKKTAQHARNRSFVQAPPRPKDRPEVSKPQLRAGPLLTPVAVLVLLAPLRGSHANVSFAVVQSLGSAAWGS